MSALRVAFILVCVAIILLAFAVIVRTQRFTGTAPTPNLNYRADRICDDAWQHDFHPDANADHFEITLREGCFSGMIYLPARFVANIGHSNHYYWQPLGSDNNWWVAIWFEGAGVPEGPFRFNQKPELINTSINK
jgi:hypothetical protein